MSSDGERFLIKPADDDALRSWIILVQNWLEELKRLVPTDP